MGFLRKAALFLAVVAICGWSGTVPAPSVNQVSVFFIPHQDDEMFMAGAIVDDLAAGKKVYTVLVTDGSASAVRYIINGRNGQNARRWSEYDRRWLRPKIEGYEPLTTSTFSVARNHEFLQSMLALGVPKENVFFGLNNEPENVNALYKDGKLKTQDAQKLIENLEQIVGVGVFNTLFPDNNNQHPDHHALGLALKNAKIISAKRFFYEHPVYGAAEELSPEARLNKLEALSSYFVWSPTQGRFAVGAHSVQNRLIFWRRYPFEFSTGELK